MAKTFHNLSTNSPGEKRNWQNNRAKDANAPGHKKGTAKQPIPGIADTSLVRSPRLKPKV